jgi:eukaryotic-like serine/threonine-protein kinase
MADAPDDDAIPASAPAAPSPQPDGPPVAGAAAVEDAALASTVEPKAIGSGELATLPQRPEGDRMARAVARAKIASSLFPVNEQVTLGRYRLLEMVGAGGMGVVWGAWDPKLERRVAIKLVKATMQAARDRILLEGQALAKLSHPNVVPVFDVGVYEEQVYLVMEWVRGKNLRAYCKDPRSVREILRIYREAGEGLLAAHRAGLIHRDFKPDNAILGDDGRVRVLDFGLARESPNAHLERAEPSESSETTRGAGTPRYMPPEQAAGAALTAAVDQYALCVSLREALTGRDPAFKEAEIPRWIAELLARGTAREPAARFPSMSELLAALDRDPAKLWRRRSLVAGAAAMAVAAFAVGRTRSAKDADLCVGGQEEIERVAGPALRESVAGHLRVLGPFATQEAARLEAHLADYGLRWAQAHRDACLARERHEVTSEMYDRNASCLIRGKAALGTIVGVLAKVSSDELPRALAAVRDLPSIDRCLTAAAASTVAPPPPELAGAVATLTSEAESVRILGKAARPEGEHAAAQLVTAARQLGYLPLLAQALLSQQIVRVVQKPPHGVQLPPLHEATQLALQIGDDELAVETFARELFVRSRNGQNDGQTGRDLIEALALRLGPAGRFQRALLYNNIGNASLGTGERKVAQSWFRRALDEARLDTTESVELAYIPMNLALSVDSAAEAEKLFTEGLARITALLGPQHPMVLVAQSGFVLFTANAELAFRRSTAACEGYLKWHPHLVQEAAECSYRPGWLADERGDSAAAMRWMKVAAGSTSDDGAIARAYLLLGSRDAQVAAEMDALAGARRGAEIWWKRTWAADAGLLAALAWRRLGQPKKARASLEAALPVIEETEHIQSNPFHQRRLSRVRAELARELGTSAMAADRTSAKQLAALAIAWYRQAGGYDAAIQRLAAIAEPDAP